jgi:hypothetical protein
MYATAVGLIMRGFEYIETYRKTFSAGRQDEYIRPPYVDISERELEEEVSVPDQEPQEVKTSLAEKIKMMMSKMFEVEDQTIN